MISDERDATVVRRRGRPRKNPKIEGKKLFDEKSSSEEDDEISDGQDDEENQAEDDEGAPLIQSIRASAKLRSLRVAREESRGQTSRGESAHSTVNLSFQGHQV